MKYKVLNAMKTGSFQSKFGEMVKYTVQLEGEQDAVELVQKPDSPAPSGEIEGTIETTQYGKKFKKEQSFGGKGSFGSKADPANFFVSYGKDAAIALLNNGIIKTPQELADQWTKYATLAQGLYNKLSKGENPVKTADHNGVGTMPKGTVISATSDETPMPTDEDFDKEFPKHEEEIDVEDIPL